MSTKTPANIHSSESGAQPTPISLALHQREEDSVRRCQLTEVRESLPLELRQAVALVGDTDDVFLADVDGHRSVVIQQEFMARDAGDAWPESATEVTKRLQRSLLRHVLGQSDDAEGAIAGVAQDPKTTFLGRPTVLVALPEAVASAARVARVVASLRRYAYGPA
jgi:hypothetical protein